MAGYGYGVGDGLYANQFPPQNPYSQQSLAGCSCPSCRANETPRERSLGNEIDYLKDKNRRLMDDLKMQLMMSQSSQPKKKMEKLTTLAKKIFDADTRLFIKAGILGKDLEVTEEGINFLLAQYLSDNKAALAKEAKKLVDERKEEDED